MTEMSDQPLSPAQDALRRAEEAMRMAAQRPQSPPPPQTSPEDDQRREAIAEQCLEDLITLPNITLIAYLRYKNAYPLNYGPSVPANDDLADYGPSFPAIVDLVYHLHRGLDVAGGRLAGAGEAGFSDSNSPAEAAATINDWMTRLQDDSIEYLFAWHVCGDSRAHLVQTRSFGLVFLVLSANCSMTSFVGCFHRLNMEMYKMGGAKSLWIDRLEAGMSVEDASNPDIPIPRVITQGMLAEYRWLQYLDRRRRALREQLISLYEQGAEVMPGELEVELRHVQRRACTWGNLASLLGEEQAGYLQSLVAPKEYRRLLVRPGTNILPPGADGHVVPPA